MSNKDDLNYMDRSAKIEVEKIDAPGSGIALECPADLDGDSAKIFQVLAEDGKDRYQKEDVYALSEYAKLIEQRMLCDKEATELLRSGDMDGYDEAVKRVEKLGRMENALRKDLGINPMSRISISSRRRGSATLKMNGAPRSVGQARNQAIAKLEAKWEESDGDTS